MSRLIRFVIWYTRDMSLQFSPSKTEILLFYFIFFFSLWSWPSASKYWSLLHFLTHCNLIKSDTQNFYYISDGAGWERRKWSTTCGTAQARSRSFSHLINKRWAWTRKATTEKKSKVKYMNKLYVHLVSFLLIHKKKFVWSGSLTYVVTLSWLFTEFEAVCLQRHIYVTYSTKFSELML